MAEFPWETELRGAIRAELAELCEPSIRPTTTEERQEFARLAQLGHIQLSCDSRIDSVPWYGFPRRLVADLIRLEARYSSLWRRFEEQDAAEAELKREIARLKSGKSRKRRAS